MGKLEKRISTMGSNPTFITNAHTQTLTGGAEVSARLADERGVAGETEFGALLEEGGEQ